MNEILAGVIGAVAAAAVIGLGAGGVRFVRGRVKLTGPTSETVETQGKQLAILRALVFMLVGTNKPQLVALLGILSALREKMNGDFERAHSGIQTAIDEHDKTLKRIAEGKCEEPKEGGD